LHLLLLDLNETDGLIGMNVSFGVILLFVTLWKCGRQLHNRRCVWQK